MIPIYYEHYCPTCGQRNSAIGDPGATPLADLRAEYDEYRKIAAEEIAALRDRVAELEAALQGVENNVTLGWRTRSWIRSRKRSSDNDQKASEK